MHAEQAIERFGPLVMSLIWRINGNHDETADLYQEVFVKFHETTSQRGPLQQPKAWLCRTAINAALDFKRQRARFVSWSESAEQPHNWGTNDVDVVENGLMVEKIRHLTADLPERRRQVFVLRYFQGCSFEQIAQLLNCSAGAARAAAFQAAKQIRAWLACDCPSTTTSNPKEMNR